MEFSGTIEGLDTIKARLKALSDEAQYKGGRFALRKAANVVRDAAVANASRFDDQSTPESIAKNISVRFSSRAFKKRKELFFRVGVLGGARAPTAVGALRSRRKRPGGDTFYWRYREFGTQHQSAQPFMRPALSRNSAKATQTFVNQFDKAITRAIKRQAKVTR